MFLLLLLSLRWSHAASSRYLIPIITHGPNNQLGQFKHAMTLARMLDRTVILPPLFEHYSDWTDRKSSHQWLGETHASCSHTSLNLLTHKPNIPPSVSIQTSTTSWSVAIRELQLSICIPPVVDDGGDNNDCLMAC